jgi:hypothetical protein
MTLATGRGHYIHREDPVLVTGEIRTVVAMAAEKTRAPQ